MMIKYSTIRPRLWTLHTIWTWKLPISKLEGEEEEEGEEGRAREHVIVGMYV